MTILLMFGWKSQVTACDVVPRGIFAYGILFVCFEKMFILNFEIRRTL